MSLIRKNILIYPHLSFNLSDGGVTVQYYLAQILKEMGENVKMYNSRGKKENNIFTEYINNISKEELENTIVIYCEGIQEDYLEKFNKYKYFISYDPMTFLIIISLICGCISIVYPLEGFSKKEWIKNTSIGDFINKINGELYGLAYGNTKEEIEYAEKTIHLAENQYKELKLYMINNLIKPFINDINKFEENINTIENNFL